jgi:hypothetical protein
MMAHSLVGMHLHLMEVGSLGSLLTLYLMGLMSMWTFLTCASRCGEIVSESPIANIVFIKMCVQLGSYEENQTISSGRLGYFGNGSLSKS